MTTRAVNNIDQDVRLNRALWSLGERMAIARIGRVAAPRCGTRDDACDRKPEHRTTAWDPSAGLFLLRTSFGDDAALTIMRASED